MTIQSIPKAIKIQTFDSALKARAWIGNLFRIYNDGNVFVEEVSFEPRMKEDSEIGDNKNDEMEWHLHE